MTERTIDEPVNNVSFRYGMVHFILSHSYVVFLMAVILGAISHMIFNVSIFSAPIYPYIGFAMIVFGSIIIYWAQSTSSCTRKEVKTGEKTERDFERGPYKYSRSPTHNGLTIMTLGLSLILNSFFTFIFIIIASIVTKLIFLKEEEALLEEKYGSVYCDYKKKVKMWL